MDLVPTDLDMVERVMERVLCLEAAGQVVVCQGVEVTTVNGHQRTTEVKHLNDQGALRMLHLHRAERLFYACNIVVNRA